MDHEAVRSFVVDAHRNGYARSSPDADGELAGKVIEYADGDWRYVDRYYGSRRFVGSEVVLFDGTPTWGMHYYGAPTGEAVDHGQVYEFLRDVLGCASQEHPFRGPDGHENAPFRYRNESEGDFTGFRGRESITRESDIVYRGQYGGGIVE